MCVAGEESGFLVQFSRHVNGVLTEFVYHRFVNRWFLLITQYGKLANCYTIQFDLKSDENIPTLLQGPINDPEMHISLPITIKCNFGADTDEVHAAIQFLVNRTKLNRCPNEITLSLGLKEITGETLVVLAKIVDEIIK